MVCVTSPAQASPKTVAPYVPDADLVGEYHFTFLFWDIYDASFYAPNGRYAKDQSFALRLDYLRHLTGEKIAERTIMEMRNQGFADEEKLSLWQQSMIDLLPDVEKGDSIIGIRDDRDRAIFYLNGSRLGLVDDPAFSRAFFDIWLSEKTSQPQMRQKLLNL